MVKILFVCLGNICRSPMAEGVFRKLLRERDLEGVFEVDSAGTGGWHEGEGADRRTIQTLERHGAGFPHVAREIRSSDADFDVILAADRANLRELQRRLPSAHAKLRLMIPDTEIPDPYLGAQDGFERIYALLEVSLGNLLEELTPRANSSTV
jgi:protein-tyrosine phosphatase